MRPAAARPSLKLGGKAGVQGPKVTMGTSANIQLYGEQSGDLTTLAVVSEPAELNVRDAAEVSSAPPKAAAPPKAVALAPPKAVAPPSKAAKDLSKYDEDLQNLAIDIIGEDSANPYKDKTERPIYPIQSRLGFQKQILKVYSSFIKIPEPGKAPDFDACKKLGAGPQQQLETYEYQKFVRDYMRQASPYRGLLVYHGLGSGKTCSAIAAAEALFSVSKKRIIVMTPFSLRDNFIREVTFCGFRHFRLQNHWVSLDKGNPTIALFAKEILGLSDKFIKKANTFWVPDFDEHKQANFSGLDTDKRQEIIKQLFEQITSRIEFINYNGITASKLKELACRPLDAEGNGPFDNKVIVVDEIHNLTRLMQGTIEPYLTSLPGLKRKVPLEPVTPGHWEPALCKKATDPRRPYLTNYKRGYLLYRLLQGARNSKIIGLSGTPLINFPEEIAILMNLLGGYIHTSSFTVSPASEQNKKVIQDILIGNPHVDFEEVELQGMNMSVMFTCLPEGMIKARDAEGTLGVQRTASAGGAEAAGGAKVPAIHEITEQIVAALKTKGMKIMKQPEFKSEPLLPPIGEEFRNNFLEVDGTTLKNKVVLRKRLQGLVSYYRGSKKELMPTVTKDELVKVPFTPYAQSEYLRVRGAELKQQAEQKKKPAQGGVAGAAAAGKMGNLWAELYELAKMKSPNSYRMFSRQSCNFAFPEGITRPRPNSQQDAIAEIGADKEIVDATLGGSGSDLEQFTFTDGGDEEGEGEGAGDNAAEAEDAAIDEGEKQDFIEEARAAGDEEAAEQAAVEGDTLLIAPLEAVAAVPLAGAAAAAPQGEKKTLTAANILRQQQAKLTEECKRGLGPGEKYLVATARAKKCLRSFASPRLRLYTPSKTSIQALQESGSVPDPERLPKFSPKYAKILENVLSSPGSSLVYSQFLDMEGIGIFLVVLEINEFQPIVIEADGSGSFRFSAATVKSLMRNKEQGQGQGQGRVNRFLSFTGGEGRDIRSLALKVFNAKYSSSSSSSSGGGGGGGGEPIGSFSDLPQQMSDVLVEAGFKGNLNGELCRVFCITSAGAEGLSLKNVRRVHIMEPYWNPVRTDQVKGRAVRICSHIDLEYSESPELNQRTVEVFTYCATFSPDALIHPDGSTGFPRIDMTVLSGDGMKPAEAVKMGFIVPEGAKDYVVTSDEYLYSLSENKKKLLQNIQDLMKTSAVDCQINEYENEDDGLGCITIPGTPEQYAFHPVLQKDIAETSTRFKEDDLNGSASSTAAGDAIRVEEEKAEGERSDAPLKEAQQQQQKQKQKQKRVIEAFYFTYDSVKYLAVPVMGKGGSALSYDIFSEGDKRRLKKLGSMVADAQGNPTEDIVMF